MSIWGVKKHKEMFRLKKKKFFDDEASLSGSDVGSDLDEDEEGANEYDLDECERPFLVRFNNMFFR